MRILCELCVFGGEIVRISRMDFIKNLLHPENLVAYGYVTLFLIIFAETGLLLGFFLPGDSLLFVAGAFAAAGKFNIALLIPLLIVAAIAGDGVGYLLGRKIGPALFAREDSRLFKRAHLQKTQDFYDKHGAKTIVLARFVPIVRTFAPTVAGAAQMPYATFVRFNVLGGIGWICSMTLLGFFLGNIPIVKNNFDKAVILIVLISILPMILHFVQERRHAKAGSSAVAATTTIGAEDA